MKERNKKNTKGITLIALIITIVVLLILAIVTIGALKNSKIITHAQNAEIESKLGGIEEQANLKYTELLLDYQTGESDEPPTLEKVIEELIKSGYEIKSVANGNSVPSIKLDKDSVSMTTNTTYKLNINYDNSVSEGNTYYAVVKKKYYKITSETDKIKVSRTASDLEGSSGDVLLEAVSSDSCVSVEINGDEIILTSLDNTGTAIITVTYGSFSASCEVKVENIYMNARMSKLTKGISINDAYKIYSNNSILQGIVEISFETSIPDNITEFKNYWDISSDKEGNYNNLGKAYAWITGENNQKVLHYGQDGGIILSQKGFTVPMCCDLTTITGLENINTSNVTDMSYMFFYCVNLSSDLDLSTFNTENVTDMACMICQCGANVSGIKINISGFNTENVTDMSNMLTAATEIVGLDDLDTGNVTNMGSMFYAYQGNSLDLSNLDTGNVTDMSFMFAHTKLEKVDISNFNTKSVINMQSMFVNSNKLTEIKFGDNIDTQSVTNMAAMFKMCSSLTELDLSKFDTNNVADMHQMFSYCDELLVLKLNKFNTEKVTDYEYLFGLGKGGGTDVKKTVEITTNSRMKEWLNTNFPSYTNIIVVDE